MTLPLLITIFLLFVSIIHATCLLPAPLCDIIEGTVQILSNITDDVVEGLGTVVEVGGDFILKNINVAELVLNNLTRVEGNLIVSGSVNLTSLQMQNLVSIGGLIINDNPNLDDLSLGFLQNVSGDLIISNNPLLRSLGGISGLTLITGDLIIQDMELSDLTFFSFLTEINSSLTINNTALLDMEGLSSLTKIGLALKIFDNPNLTNLNSLLNLAFAKDIIIINNVALSSLEGLKNVLKTVESFILRSQALFLCSETFNEISDTFNVNETCYCLPGFYGRSCIQCNCDQGDCKDTVTGDGNCECFSGFDGVDCSECAKGYGGDNCNVCAKGYEGVNCSTCAKGYNGVNCSECAEGYDGDNCSVIMQCNGDCVQTEQGCDCSPDSLEKYFHDRTGDTVYITGKHVLDVDIILEVINVSLNESEIIVHGSLTLNNVNLTISKSIFEIDNCVTINDTSLNITASGIDIANGSMTLVVLNCPSYAKNEFIMGVDFIINGEKDNCAQFEYSETHLTVLFNTGCQVGGEEDKFLPFIVAACVIVAALVVFLLVIALVKPVNSMLFPYRNRGVSTELMEQKLFMPTKLHTRGI